MTQTCDDVVCRETFYAYKTNFDNEAHWCYVLCNRILGFQMPLKNFIMSVIAKISQVVPAFEAKVLMNKSEDIYLAFNCA